jgi:hypothetical protein
VKLVVLYGPPAVGKLSGTQALAARTGFCVLHNHLLMDLGRALFGWEEPSQAFTRRLRDVSLEAARKENLPGVIVTFVYARDRDAYILRLCDEAQRLGDDVCLVHLTCEMGTLEARVTEPSRGAFDKLTTVAGLREKLETLDAPFARVQGRESLSLQTDRRTPGEVAEAVQRYFGL